MLFGATPAEDGKACVGGFEGGLDAWVADYGAPGAGHAGGPVDVVEDDDGQWSEHVEASADVAQGGRLGVVAVDIDHAGLVAAEQGVDDVVEVCDDDFDVADVVFVEHAAGDLCALGRAFDGANPGCGSRGGHIEGAHAQRGAEFQDIVGLELPDEAGEHESVFLADGCAAGYGADCDGAAGGAGAEVGQAEGRCVAE